MICLAITGVLTRLIAYPHEETLAKYLTRLASEQLRSRCQSSCGEANNLPRDWNSSNAKSDVAPGSWTGRSSSSDCSGKRLLLAENRAHSPQGQPDPNHACADVFDYIERFYKPAAKALDSRLRRLIDLRSIPDIARENMNRRTWDFCSVRSKCLGERFGRRA